MGPVWEALVFMWTSPSGPQGYLCSPVSSSSRAATSSTKPPLSLYTLLCHLGGLEQWLGQRLGPSEPLALDTFLSRGTWGKLHVTALGLRGLLCDVAA